MLLWYILLIQIIKENCFSGVIQPYREKLGPVKIYAQIYLQAPADLKSAGNGDVVQSRLQVLHIHVFLVAPLGARHVA